MGMTMRDYKNRTILNEIYSSLNNIHFDNPTADDLKNNVNEELFDIICFLDTIHPQEAK